MMRATTTMRSTTNATTTSAVAGPMTLAILTLVGEGTRGNTSGSGRGGATAVVLVSYHVFIPFFWRLTNDTSLYCISSTFPLDLHLRPCEIYGLSICIWNLSRPGGIQLVALVPVPLSLVSSSLWSGSRTLN